MRETESLHQTEDSVEEENEEEDHEVEGAVIAEGLIYRSEPEKKSTRREEAELD